MPTIVLLALPLAAEAARLSPVDRMNVVFIVADDLGASDLGCYGADLHETPRIDALAATGMRFSQAYAPSPVCSPTRAAILTGKSPARLRMTVWSEQARNPVSDLPLQPAYSRSDLPHAETTLATLFQKAGYLTAVVGKWHLGDADHAPQSHGFDVNIGGTHWGAPHSFFYPYRGTGRFGSQFRYVPGLDFGTQGEYLTDRLTDEAIRVIDRAAGKPFFLWLAHYAVHTPMEAKPADVERFRLKLRDDLRHRNPVYAAMTWSLDQSVGRILDALHQRGLDEKTIVVFTSDNGGFIGFNRESNGVVTNNAPFRSGKGSLYEGGIRVPLIVRWPGRTTQASIASSPVVLTDWFPTLCAGLGLTEGSRRDCDGVDLVPVLSDGKAKLLRRSLYFHFPHYYPTTTPAAAIRRGDDKLIYYFEDGRRELYQLSADPSESQDRSEAEPQKALELWRELDEWLHDVGAERPARRVR